MVFLPTKMRFCYSPVASIALEVCQVLNFMCT